MNEDPAVNLRAYNDSAGQTRDFNLNLPHRINRELGADVDVSRFIHVPVYCPMTGRALSYLVSTCDQSVHIPGADTEIRFRAWEALHTEISQKYHPIMIEDLAGNAGLRITDRFTDSNEFFFDVVMAMDRAHT